MEVAVKGNFETDPGRCRIVVKLDDRELLQKEFGKKFTSRTWNTIERIAKLLEHGTQGRAGRPAAASLRG